MHCAQDAAKEEMIAVLSKENAALQAEVERYRALMELASVDIVFFHEQGSPFIGSDPAQIGVVEFSILTNDLFYPGADAEGFGISDAVTLRDIYRARGQEGVIRWVQKKRDNQLLRPHVEKRVKEREDLRAERDSLREQLRVMQEPVSDSICAFLDTPEAIDILKWMCFQLGRMAHIFAEDGENIPQKAEEEQSFMLRKMLKHAAKHGTEWRKFAADELEAAHKRVVAARAAKAKEGK